MKPAWQAAWFAAGLCAGVGLSFFAFGLLWVGAAWPWQFLMAAPFALAGYLAQRFGGSALPVLAGLFPLGALVVQARDKNDSHAMSIALVAAWVLGTLLGAYLARRRSGQAGP